jgi:phosphatidylserine/phosphatidylglycerophosphate/cardiolipin synthase-like enzyme
MRPTHLTLPLLLLLSSPLLAQEEQVVFSPRERQDFAISEVLRDATTSIDMALYSISHESEWVDEPGPNASPAQIERHQAFRARLESGEVMVFDMLKKKSLEDGVPCRLVLHRAGLDSWAVDRAEAYEEIGVEVRWTHKTMHHKYAIVDGSTLINGSGNWSRGAAERYSENTTIYTGHTWLVRKFQREFRYLWETLLKKGRAEEFEGAAASEPDVNHFERRWVKHWGFDPVEAYFTSENRSSSTYVVADRIIKMMRRADEQILIMINHFNMRRISDALIQIHEERNENADPDDDIEIKVLLDLGEYDAWISKARQLERAGIECRYKFFGLGFWYPRAQFMHHKVLIVDGEQMITGSYNWSRTAEHKNYENITVHRGSSQQDLIDRMEEEFTYLWDLRRDLVERFTAAVLSQPGDANYRRFVPVHFMRHDYYHTPLSMTRDEIEVVRNHLEGLGYAAPKSDEEDPAIQEQNGKYFFDKETGEYTNAVPDGVFIEGQGDVQAGPNVANAVNNTAGPAPEAHGAANVLGAATTSTP